MIVRRGEDVSFTCTSMGGPNNAYNWKKGEYTVANGSILTLTDINASHGGRYTCTVNNLAGVDSADTTLYVAPYFVTQPETSVETTIGSGADINFTCKAESFPDPEYVWLKNGGSEMPREGVFSAEMPNVLTFRQVRFGDEGIYTCVASITIGVIVYNASSNAVLLVGKVYLLARSGNMPMEIILL